MEKMNMKNMFSRRVAIFGVVLLSLLWAAPSFAAAGSKLASITNSSSTNTIGYTLTLYSDGSGVLRYAEPIIKGQHFPAHTFNTQQLAAQLNMVKDVSHIPSSPFCIKSSSFGTTTTITYQGKTSPDLSCADYHATPAQQALIETVKQLTNQFPEKPKSEVR